MIFLSCLPFVRPHLGYCATYGLPDAREILINWKELVERLALRKKWLKRDLITLFQDLMGDYREDRDELFSDRNEKKKRQ